MKAKIHIHESRGCVLRSCSKQRPSLSFALFSKYLLHMPERVQTPENKAAGCSNVMRGVSNRPNQKTDLSTNKQFTTTGDGGEQ